MDSAEAYEATLARARGDLGRLARRLRHLSEGAWRTRRGPVVTLLSALARLDGVVEADRLQRLERLPSYACSDAVSVLGGDAIEALAGSVDPPSLSQLSDALDAALGGTA